MFLATLVSFAPPSTYHASSCASWRKEGCPTSGPRTAHLQGAYSICSFYPGSASTQCEASRSPWAINCPFMSFLQLLEGTTIKQWSIISSTSLHMALVQHSLRKWPVFPHLKQLLVLGQGWLLWRPVILSQAELRQVVPWASSPVAELCPSTPILALSFTIFITLNNLHRVISFAVHDLRVPGLFLFLNWTRDIYFLPLIFIHWNQWIKIGC